MSNIWIFGIILFLITITVFYKLTIGPYKKEFGTKYLKVFGGNLWYWQSAIYASAGITVGIMFLLKWGNVLNF